MTPPHEHEDSLLAAPLAKLTRWVLRYPRSVLAAAVLLAAGAVLFTATRLEFRTSRLDLISPDSDYNKLWLAHIKEFGDVDDTVVVVQAIDDKNGAEVVRLQGAKAKSALGDASPNSHEFGYKKSVIAALDDLAELLHQESNHFDAVLHRVDLSPIRGKGLYYLSLPELQQIDSSLDQIEPVLDGDWSLLRVDQQLAAVAGGAAHASRYAVAAPPRTAAGIAHLGRLGESLAAAFEGDGRYVSCWPAGCERLRNIDQAETEYLLANDGQLGFIMLRLAKDKRSGPHAAARADRASAAAPRRREDRPHRPARDGKRRNARQPARHALRDDLEHGGRAAGVHRRLGRPAAFAARLRRVPAGDGLDVRLRRGHRRPFEHSQRVVRRDADRTGRRFLHSLCRPLLEAAR
jgi:hypothetical protein